MNIGEIARMYATEKHKGQKRKNGEDYIVHPNSVAALLLKYKKSHNINRLRAVAYLHDILEETDTTYYELVDIFGYDIASMVLELTNNKEMKNALGKSVYLAYKLKYITSWALTIKLCDRLDNISDIEKLDEEFRTRYSEETFFIINYLLENRILSNTQRNIINDIVLTLKKNSKQCVLKCS